MKTTGLIVLFTFFCLGSFSQNNYYNDKMYFASQPEGYLQKWIYSPIDKKTAKENKITTLIQKSGSCPMNSDSINKGLSISTYGFDVAGNTTSYKRVNKKGKSVWNIEVTYNSANKITDYRHRYKNSKKLYTEKYQYDKLNQVVEKLTTHNNKPSKRYVCTYDSNRARQMLVYKKGKLWQRYEYTYFSDGKNLETKRYDKKGKLQYTWSFVCRDEGENTRKMKDSTLICKKDSHDLQGNRVLVYLQTNEKGKTTRSVYVYRPDTVLRESRGYDEKDHLTWKCLYDGKHKGCSEYIWYRYKKNKEEIKTRSLYTYDDMDNRTNNTYEYYKRGKINKTENYQHFYTPKRPM